MEPKPRLLTEKEKRDLKESGTTKQIVYDSYERLAEWGDHKRETDRKGGYGIYESSEENLEKV
jgi:hypothetical protein